MLKVVDFEFIRNFWNNEFYRYSVDELNKYPLNEETIMFLSEVGLFNQKSRGSSMEFLEIFEMKIYDNRKFIKIGKSYVGEFCLNEIENEVFYFVFSRKNIFENSYCNSSVFEYTLFETIRKKITGTYEDVADEALKGFECARAIVEEFKKINEKTIYPYSYWSIILYNYAINYFYDEDDKFEEAMKKGKYKNFEEAYFDVLFNGFDVLK